MRHGVPLWKEWVKKRELKENDDPDSGFKFNSDDANFGVDHDHIKKEIADTLWNSYTDEFMQFINGIAQRGDPELQQLLSKLEKDQAPTKSPEPRHDNRPEVVPPNADTGSSEDAGGDE